VTAHPTWPDRRTVALWFGAFAIYAGIDGAFAGHEDAAWGIWGFAAYTVAALLLRYGQRWWPGLTVALAGGLAGPFAYLAIREAVPAEVTVLTRGARYLLAHGTPYLPKSQLTDWTSYNPYLPVMEAFGIPRAAGLPGLLGDPRLYTSLVTIALLWVSFAVMTPHRTRDCHDCRGHALRLTVILAASPLIAFPLALGITDPPLIALTCLALALLAREWLLRASLVVAIACAMKYTAWALVPVFAVMLWVRYSPRVAAWFTATTIGSAAILAFITAPRALAQSASLVANTVAFPLGLTKQKTPAASPLPGHLIASLGSAGHTTAIAILGIAAVAFVAWLVARPPKDARAAGYRLAVGYAGMFTLDPSTRFGYYVYPLCIVAWLALTKFQATAPPVPRSVPGLRRRLALGQRVHRGPAEPAVSRGRPG
jgi:phosphatidylinositol alpha-1,6-mannosyltransferase